MNHRPWVKSFIVALGCLFLLGSLGAISTAHAKRRQITLFRSEVKLSPGHESAVRQTKLRIKFMLVESDSRCPRDVECVWAGNAAIRLQLRGLGKSKRVTLNTSQAKPFGNATIYQGYRITLIDLSPSPVSTRKIVPSDYQATLLITKG